MPSASPRCSSPRTRSSRWIRRPVATSKQVAGECADLFQRSSSCVEGRNGFLALYQHGHHRLGPRKQQVLTALHNFAIQRLDGTTAAQRFFAQPHPSLFEQVLRAHALARSTGPTTTAPGEAAVPRPCGGLATVDQSMIKAVSNDEGLSVTETLAT